MAALTALAAALLLLSCSAVVAVPSPQSIGSDLTILTHNDLYGNSSSRQAAALVLTKPQSLSRASSSCAALAESLWKTSNTSQDLSFLRYLRHGKRVDEPSLYWVGGSPACRAMDTDGHVASVDCDALLPALCSQSAVLSTAASADASPKWQTEVKTGNASYVGYRDKLSFRFLGIKYASQPARFRHSRYTPPGGTNISALSYGAQCVQSGCGSTLSCSEDCLTLNIWTPHLPSQVTSSSEKRAVLVWIHGGGFVGGSGVDPTFDGGNMASRGDVVVVTINYRLSTLGFLALDNTTIAGNYGLADQNTALSWIRSHVEDFGGDKDRITVFGQSAGAASVRALLASPQASGKFSGAIMQSNPEGAQYASTFTKYLTILEATKLTAGLLNEVGCAQTDQAVLLACLQKLDPLTLVGKRNGSWTGTVARYPVVDGTYLTSEQLPLGASAKKLNVSVMAGIMRDDGGPFSAFSKSSNASQALTEQGYNSTAILSSTAFPLPHGSNVTMDIFNLTARVATDAEFRCLAQSTAAVATANDVFPVLYSYEFDRAYQIVEWSPNPPTCEAPPSSERPNGDVRKPYFRCHSGELYYVFGTLSRQGRPPRDDDDIPFSQYVVDTWTAFARERNPNPSPDFLAARRFSNTSAIVQGSGPWTPVQKESLLLRVLDTNARNERFREMDQCAVLDYPLSYYSR